MDEIREILGQVTRSTLAAEAVKKAVEDMKTNATDWSKLITKPSLFEHKSQEEEIKAFNEFVQWMRRT